MANGSVKFSFLKDDVDYFSLDQHNVVFLLPEHWTSRDFSPFKTVKLKSSQDITVYQGKLAPGGLGIFVGYTLRNSKLIIINRKVLLSLILPGFEPGLNEFPSVLIEP